MLQQHVASVPVVIIMLPEAAQDTWVSGCSICGNIQQTYNIGDWTEHNNTIIGNMNTIIGTNTFCPNITYKSVEILHIPRRGEIVFN